MNKKRIKIHDHLYSLGKRISSKKIIDQDNSEEDYSGNIETELLNFDFSKQRFSKESLDFLLEIPDELDIRGSFYSLFQGQFQNPS